MLRGERKTVDPSTSLGMTKGEGSAHLSSRYRGMGKVARVQLPCPATCVARSYPIAAARCVVYNGSEKHGAAKDTKV
jgi:hypothetical protein